VGSLAIAPLPLARLLSKFYARLLDRAVPKLRRTAYRNLAIALPNADAKKITDGVFESIARILLTVARFPHITQNNVRDLIDYEGLHHFTEAKQRGRGVLFATAHLGNWELSAFAHALLTEPMDVVVRPLDNPHIDKLVERRRTLSGNTVIGKRDVVRGILRALARNRAVGVLIDQNASPEEGVFVDFFGLQASAHAGFARLAHRSGAAVIPGFALWCPEKKRYVLRFYPPVLISGDTQLDTAKIQRAIEDVVRAHPDQWLWIHRRWKTRPHGEPSFY
jgi:KDO2-lipid IV(A) lauroyltransferase